MQDYIWDYRDPYEWMERTAKFPPMIITCAVDGGIQGKESHPGAAGAAGGDRARVAGRLRGRRLHRAHPRARPG